MTWEIFLQNQSLTFLYAIQFGGLFCILYDFFRILRVLKKYGKFHIVLQDLLYWLIVTFLTFLFLLSRTNGAVRGFVLVGELLGFIIWRLTFSCWLYPFFSKLFGKIALLLASVEAKKTSFLIKGTFKLEKVLKITLKKLKKGLKKGWDLLYTKRNHQIK